MARRNPKKSGSSKKNRPKRQNNAKANSTADLDEVICQADQAMETANVEQALQLYHYAVFTLRNIVSVTSENGMAKNQLMLARVLSKLGEAKVSTGDQDGGRSDFNDALVLLDSFDDSEGTSSNKDNGAPLIEEWKESKASICMYLGQLSNGNEALGYFNKSIGNLRECIGILEARLVKSRNGADFRDINDDTSIPEKNLIETRQQLCTAFCSVAELYLTDLCDEVDAENKCESFLKDALQLNDNESTPDARQAMANLRLSQSRGVEAIPYILQVYDQMKETVTAMTDLVGLGRGEENSDQCVTSEDSKYNSSNGLKELNEDVLHDTNKLPSFEFRCQTAKILLECASVLDEHPGSKKSSRLSSDPHKCSSNIDDTEQRPYCIEAAIQVLGSLLAENDEVVEVWYLLGCAFVSTVPVNIEAAEYYWKAALEMLGKVKQGVEQDMSMVEDDEVEGVQSEIDDVNSKMKELKLKLSELEEMKCNAMDEG